MIKSLEVDQVGGWLRGFIQEEGGSSGTIHCRVSDENLGLAAAHNIPEQVVELVRTIPKGKGMAGLAWERAEPVSTCNLQNDRTGDVRPGARAVAAQAAVALPVYDAQGELRAVLGIAFKDERQLGADQLAALQDKAQALPAF